MGRYGALLEPSKALQTRKDNPENVNSGIPENLKAGIPEITKSGLPVSPNSGIPENLKTRNQQVEPFVKAEKYSTQLLPSVIKRIKQFAAEHDIKDYIVVQTAIEEYFERNTEP